MNKPKITFPELQAKFGSEMAKIKDPVYLVGIRGYYKNSMGETGKNDIGIYDDAFCLIAPSFYSTYNGNTDPAKHNFGIATLIPGLYLFKKGKHGISKPGGGYPAFRPATPDESLPVTRTGKKGVFKGVAINIHKGGYNTTGSAGCQTIYPDQWQDFQTTVYKLLSDHQQDKFPYLLVEF